ncbi:MAG TPA: DUF4870 domain-containing protein [Ktedonobacterales bacterium]
MSGAQTNTLSFTLRSGEMCALSPDTLTVGQRAIPLRDIVSAGLVADTSVPVAPGMPPTPGVSLRLSDGDTLAFTPLEQLDCWRLLQALYAAQPRLSAPLPPPLGGTAYGAAYGAPPPYYGAPPMYGYAPVGPTESEKTLAGLCHLSVFFAPLILPLIIWLAMRRSQPYASTQGKQAFFFHLGFSILVIIGVVSVQAIFLSGVFAAAQAASATSPLNFELTMLPLVLAIYGALVVVGLVDAIFSVIAAVQTFQGKPYHYPMLGWLRP